MELVRGIRITDYCDQANLSTKERLDLFIKVCHAIQHANQKGIIHRDIKPSNILVTLHDGVPVPKVIDFGIAKATEGRLTDNTVYTQLHQFIGTPAYMSPEQAEMSGLDIDTRSDVYSLGVLLYELLAGSTPFDAKELMASGLDAMRKTIREEEPQRPSTRLATLQGEDLTTTAKRRSADTSKLLHQLQGDLDWIVMKCLEKDRTRRYETANGIAADLKRHLNNEPVLARPPGAAYRLQKLLRRNKAILPVVGFVLALTLVAVAWWLYRPPGQMANHQTNFPSSPGATGAASATDQKSIAVLPFVNMSADKADEYLSDGMTEELLNVLAQVPGLRVPGRSSSFAFKGRTEDKIFRKVGEQLHVTTVLEGSVRKAGDKLRITAQLINVADGLLLWSQTYDRDMKDILAVQTEVAQQVVQALQVKLGVEATRALAKAPTENPEAYRLYLLGRYHFGKNTEASLTNAVQYFTQALQQDPTYALAYCGLSDCYGWMRGSLLSGKEAWAKEKELAQKALALDPKLADAHLSLGIALASAFDWKGGEQEIKRALELNSKLALAYDQLAWVQTCFGRFDEAISNEQKAIELDPLSLMFNSSLGWVLTSARRYDDAMAQYRKTLELDPNFVVAHFTLGWCFVSKGDTAGAIAAFQKAKVLDPSPWIDGALAFGYARAGDRAKAEQMVRDWDDVAKQRYVSSALRMHLHLGLGEKDKALDWLEKCYEEQDGVCWGLKVYPTFDPLRTEPRFHALLKKVFPEP